MKRKAVLISGASKNDSEKALTNSYISVYEAYFKSNAGGAFEDDEVLIAHEPDLKTLQELVANGRPDYAVSVFIGHGADQEEKQLFKINPTDIINLGELELNVPKQIVLIESCRNIRKNIPTVQVVDRILNFRDGGVFRVPISRAKAKSLFIEQVEACDAGLVVCYACGQDEKASNFYFSKTLLEKSKAWNNSNRNVSCTLAIATLMDEVTVEVARMTQSRPKNQTPEIKGSIDFPFVISKY